MAKVDANALAVYAILQCLGTLPIKPGLPFFVEPQRLCGTFSYEILVVCPWIPWANHFQQMATLSTL